MNLGFVKSLYESTLYVKHNGAGILIILLYVDDLLVTGNHISLVEKFKLEIMEVFEMTDLGLMIFFSLEWKSNRVNMKFLFVRRNTPKRYSRSSN